MGRPGAAARRRRLATLGVATPRVIAKEQRLARRLAEQAPLVLPGGHATLYLTRTDLAILERLLTEQIFTFRVTRVQRGDDAQRRGKTYTLTRRLSRLISVADAAETNAPFALNVSIQELQILDDLVEPLASVPDDAACEELLGQIERLILGAATSSSAAASVKR